MCTVGPGVDIKQNHVSKKVNKKSNSQKVETNTVSTPPKLCFYLAPFRSYDASKLTEMQKFLLTKKQNLRNSLKM